MSSQITAVINFVFGSGVLGVVALGGSTPGGAPCLDPARMSAGTEIFEGITYGCERLKPSDEGSGYVYWARIDLKVPGIDLYVTPKDPTAVAQGWQYRLCWVGDVVESEAPRGCYQWDPLLVEFKVATLDSRRPCQKQGTIGVGPHPQSYVG